MPSKCAPPQQHVHQQAAHGLMSQLQQPRNHQVPLPASPLSSQGPSNKWQVMLQSTDIILSSPSQNLTASIPSLGENLLLNPFAFIWPFVSPYHTEHNWGHKGTKQEAFSLTRPNNKSDFYLVKMPGGWLQLVCWTQNSHLFAKIS
jgi:hypothetical protein